MKSYLRIYRNNRSVHCPKYILDINNRTVETNSKEEIKMLFDLNGMRMSRFYEYGSMKDRTSHYICYYN